MEATRAKMAHKDNVLLGRLQYIVKALIGVLKRRKVFESVLFERRKVFHMR